MAAATELAGSLTPALGSERAALTAELIHGLDAVTLNWLSGYLAGAAARAANAENVQIQPVAAVAEVPRLTVLYGSQTGNAKRIAEGLAARAEAEGIAVRLLRADSYPLHELKNERYLYLVISTHSAGDTVEPPDDSRAFVEFVSGRRAPKLPQLRYAVLALGDTSYPDFCAIGKQLDARFAELGGERLQPRGDADVDLDTVATPWLDAALALAREWQRDAAVGSVGGVTAVVMPLHPTRTAWTRTRPFAAEVLANQPIVANGHDKDVRHIELSLAGSGLVYRPGDALGVWPRQAPELVDAVLTTMGLDGAEAVTVKDETLPLSTWLTARRELTALTRPFIQAHAERGRHVALQALQAPDARDAMAALLASTQLIDLLRDYPSAWTASELVAALRPLAPRSYSIASSQRQVDEEVHVTVAVVDYQRAGEPRYGAASHYLAEAVEGSTVPVFIDGNDRFRLPVDDARDIIMVGPGTGVAPFRAFVQERAAGGARGRNWLFFGNRHRRTDFLYQLEWRQALKAGHLTRLDVAFSRDQAHKVYVQDRLREHGREVWSWLADGAHLYVCGDARHMAPDVHAALLDVAQQHGGKSPEAAVTWLEELRATGRYARDVY